MVHIDDIESGLAVIERLLGIDRGIEEDENAGHACLSMIKHDFSTSDVRISSSNSGCF